MELGCLSKTDRNNVFKFLHNIQGPNIVSQNQFRRKVIDELFNVFGYSYASFWLINNNLELYDPVCNNLYDKVVHEYLDRFYKIDPFYPKNIPSKVLFKRESDIISSRDLGPAQDKFNNAYADYLSKDFHMHHKAILQFRENHEPWAGIAIFLPKDVEDFSSKDLNCLKILCPFISHTLANKIYADTLGCKNEMYELILEQAQVGILTFDDCFKVHYANSAAKDYCAELCKKQRRTTYLDSFIKQHFIDIEDIYWRFGMEKEIFSNSMQKFKMKVVASVNKETTMYTVYLFPQNLNNKNRLNFIYDLTKREKELIPLILAGFTNQEIADKLYISLSTVKTHIENIYSKLHVTNRTTLCAKLKDI